MAKVSKVRRNKSRLKKKPRGNTLPTSPNVVPSSLLDFVFMIFGKKAIGKTTLANLLGKSAKGKTLTWMLEKGRRNLPIFQLPKKGQPYPNWSKILLWAEDFINSDKFDVLVIDTLDKFYDLCFAYVCKLHDVKTPADAGKDGSSIWKEIDAEFNALLLMLSESGKGLVILSHEKIRELETKKIRQLKEEARDSDDAEDIKAERLEPSASPAACRAVEEMCDFVFYYGYENRKRVITVRDSGDYYWVACGVPDTFLDPDGNEVNTFYVGDTPLDAKLNMMRAFNNQLRDIDYKPLNKKKVLRKKVKR